MNLDALWTLIDGWRCSAGLPCEWLPNVLGFVMAMLFVNWKKIW